MAIATALGEDQTVPVQQEPRRWSKLSEALADPVFNVARAKMGTETYGQDIALFHAISYVLSAKPDHTEALNQWNPIDTAPKNEDEILLVSADGDIGVCYWRDDNILRGWTWGLGKAFLNPTHWMPLPRNPNSQNPASQKGAA
jgi:hypothetical protein